MCDKAPLVSVVMPTYNAESTIENSISSVLSQTFTDWELLILDDCSTDNTCAVVQRYANTDRRIHFYPCAPNQGVAAMRNKGVSLSKGNYIAFLDSDDTWNPEKLKTQLDCIRRTGAEICYTSYALVDLSGQKVREDYRVPEKTDLSSLLRENVIGCSTVLLSAELAKAKPFRKDFYHEDYVLWLELLREGHKAVGCQTVLTNWCYREKSRSFNKFRSLQNRWRVYRKALQLPLAESIGYIYSYVSAGIRKYRK